MIQYLLLLLATTILASCTNFKADSSLGIVVPTKQFVIRSELTDFKDIQIHSVSSKKTDTPVSDWITYIDDIDNFFVSYPADTPKEKPVFMAEMSMERSIKDCTPSFTGSSKLTALNSKNPNTLWGYVDIYDLYAPMFDFPTEFGQLCRPPVNGAAYVLCSEHHEKSVLICLSQATKNPEQAKQIFETFRWID